MASVRVFWLVAAASALYLWTSANGRRPQQTSHVDERSQHFWEDRRNEKTPHHSRKKRGGISDQFNYRWTTSAPAPDWRHSWNRTWTEPTGGGGTSIRYSESRYTDPTNVSTTYTSTSRRYSYNQTIITRDGTTVVNRTHFSNTSYHWQTEDMHPLSQFAVYTHGGSSVPGCEESSCYPATGNLLIGREDKLWTSSTCGLRNTERYCIVSHLKERKKCFYCDSRPSERNNPRLYHGIESIVSRIGKKRKAWWQSENGVENVTIQLDLEAEFHFTHLIITFKTFRPAAMLIERSHDFGQTWKVYQYFAYDCADSFPDKPRGPRQHITDVVCDSHYSGVEPSTEGEVIFRVLLPNLPVPDPYSPAVQNLLKMTNLRINFTKLHTLGDNLLDSRFEIKEKYYYAIYDMVVRGSCSCYGHASRCIADGEQISRPDMVYGKCECTHNTKGLNCEQCEDFFNDQPWKPALGRQTNACQKCNCNGHAVKCHFDPAVWEATGRTSGECAMSASTTPWAVTVSSVSLSSTRILGGISGTPTSASVTILTHVGQLVTATHEDLSMKASASPSLIPSKEWRLENVTVRRTWKAGDVIAARRAIGTSELITQRAVNVSLSIPSLCSHSDPVPSLLLQPPGHHQQPGLQFPDRGVCLQEECGGQGLQPVSGRSAEQLPGNSPEFWGLDSQEEGCVACDCDPGGAYDNNCDVVTGQCRCKPYISGRRCDQPEPGFFAGTLDYLVYEAELAKGSQNTQVMVREPYPDRESSWTGLGFMRVQEGTHIEFDITDVPASMEYDIIIRYEPQLPGRWENVRIVLERPGPVDPSGPCAGTSAQEDVKTTTLPSGDRYVLVYSPSCLEKGKTYRIKLEFLHYNREVDTPSAFVLVDSIVLIPRVHSIPFFRGSHINDYRLQEFERFRCAQAYYGAIHQEPSEVCKKYLYSIGFYVYGHAHECSCDPTGALSTSCDGLGGQCTCKQLVVGRRCERCAPGTYGFGPSGCLPCDCNSIGSEDNFCDATSGQCKCRPNTYGRQCDECQPGFWHYPNCERCDCNSHADLCDSRTGACIDCRDNTAGHKCDRCQAGFYGDPRYGLDIPCRPCSCPGTMDSGVNHAHTCELDPRTQNVVCHCEPGYAGERCDRCANNYYGEPTVAGGGCHRCNCSQNIDVTVLGNCDSRTGECLKCLYNTDGFHCEQCRPGFFGDASLQQCIPCVCNILGTDQSQGECNRLTGQCPCLPNVVGKNCHECAPNHWKLASGKGCESCDCDLLGSFSPTCNERCAETSEALHWTRQQQEKIDMDPEQQFYTPKIENIAVIEMYGDI
ncbi:LAMB1 [Cordylochernes scorpioides]|uniref:LAMB1 n=1 Tax=Cordylochernes scorpioides TaxID=51811 RepID=A0ABY6LL20_9ARAC|nr:LAMB1 [Cordylochernes scorpioides]